MSNGINHWVPTSESCARASKRRKIVQSAISDSASPDFHDYLKQCQMALLSSSMKYDDLIRELYVLSQREGDFVESQRDVQLPESTDLKQVHNHLLTYSTKPV